MGATCEQCGRPFGLGRKRTTSITGREICTDCDGDTLAAAAGIMTNPGSEVEGAIATRGWFRLLRRRPPI